MELQRVVKQQINLPAEAAEKLLEAKGKN